MAGTGKFPLRSPWFMDQRERAGLLYGAFTVNGETAQAVVWNDYFFEAASGITGNLTLTEDNDSLSAAAAVAVSATASITEAADTLSATAAIAVVASASFVEANDTLSAAAEVAAVAVVATLSATEADDQLVAVTVLLVWASAAVSEADDTLAAIVVSSITLWGKDMRNKFLDGPPGSFRDLAANASSMRWTNEALKNYGAGMWSDMARMGGDVCGEG